MYTDVYTQKKKKRALFHRSLEQRWAAINITFRLSRSLWYQMPFSLLHPLLIPCRGGISLATKKKGGGGERAENTTSLRQILQHSEWYVCFLCLWNHHLAKNSSLIFWHEGHLKVLLPASLIHFVDKRLSQGSLRCPSLLDFLSV